MTKEELLCKLRNDLITMDDLLHLPHTMSKDEVGRVLVECYYALYVMSERDERKANKALYNTLFDMWEDEV